MKVSKFGSVLTVSGCVGKVKLPSGNFWGELTLAQSVSSKDKNNGETIYGTLWRSIKLPKMNLFPDGVNPGDFLSVVLEDCSDVWKDANNGEIKTKEKFLINQRLVHLTKDEMGTKHNQQQQSHGFTSTDGFKGNHINQ